MPDPTATKVTDIKQLPDGIWWQARNVAEAARDIELKLKNKPARIIYYHPDGKNYGVYVPVFGEKK
jgi:hypothetical protein